MANNSSHQGPIRIHYLQEHAVGLDPGGQGLGKDLLGRGFGALEGGACQGPRGGEQGRALPALAAPDEPEVPVPA